MTTYEKLIERLKEEIKLKDAISYIEKNNGCFSFLSDKNHMFKCALVVLISLFKKKITDKNMNIALEYIKIVNDQMRNDNIYIPIAYIYLILFYYKLKQGNSLAKKYFRLLKDYTIDNCGEVKGYCFKYCADLFKKKKMYECSEKMFKLAYEHLNDKELKLKLKCILEVAKISELLKDYESACYYYDLHVTNSVEKYCIVNAFSCAILSNNTELINKYINYFDKKETCGEKTIIELINASVKNKDKRYLKQVFDEYGPTPALLDIEDKIKKEI